MTENIILDSGGTNELTVYSSNIEEVRNKTLNPITPPQSTANKALGPKTTLLIDLQKIELRFNVDGFVDIADKSKFINLINQGGVVPFLYGGTSFNINFEKASITEKPEDSNATNTPAIEYVVKFTCIVGEDI